MHNFRKLASPPIAKFFNTDSKISRPPAKELDFKNKSMVNDIQDESVLLIASGLFLWLALHK